MHLEAICNFRRLGDDLATAGQPDEAQLGALAAAGYEVVINLGIDDPAYALADEASTVQALGMCYRHIPVDFKQPNPADFQAFCTCMRESAGRRIFVHCRLNWRVSVFVALYGQRELGWDQARADAHIADLWEPDPVWREFITRTRAAL